MHEVQLDIYIARRKRMHSVFDPNGIPVFHAPQMIQVLDWLAEEDVSRARFTDEESTYVVTFERCLPNSDQTPR